MPATMLAPQVDVSLPKQQDENRAIFERACRRYLGISTEEFLVRWRQGGFNDTEELAHKAAHVALLLPLLSAGTNTT